ncbi:MAG: hypothetical protein Tsb0014_33500 [Pleurocapsa sp.]
MEFLIFIELLFAIVGFISSLIILIDEIIRTHNLKEISKQIGWNFYRKGKTSQLNNLLHFYLFSLGSFKQMRNLLYSQTEELNIAIFDYHFKFDRHTDIKETVIYFRSPLLNLPNFNLLRKPHLTTNTFGDRHVVFPSNPVFSEKYSLLTDDEEAVRRVFSDRLLTYFEQKRTLNAEGANDRLILYCSDGVVQSDRIESFLEEGYRAFELFKEIQLQKSESTEKSKTQGQEPCSTKNLLAKNLMTSN